MTFAAWRPTYCSRLCSPRDLKQVDISWSQPLDKRIRHGYPFLHCFSMKTSWPPPPPQKKTFSASNIVFKGDLFPVYLYKCSFGVQFLVVLETSSRESVLRVTSSRAHTRALSAFPALLLSRSSEVWTKLTVYCYKKIQHSTAQLNLLLQWTKRANILSRPRIAVFIITTIPGW